MQGSACQITLITLWTGIAHSIGWAWSQAIIAHVLEQLISFVAKACSSEKCFQD